MKISIIDVGTKSIKHLVFEDKKQILFTKDSSIKLGEEILKTNHLEENKIKNALDHIKKLIEINNRYDVSKTIVIGTDALRRADNSKEFIDLLKKETNTDIRVISHKEEAELLGKAYGGLIEGDFVASDVGGGSTEVIFFKDKIMHTVLIPFGVNKIQQHFLAEAYSRFEFDNEEAWNKVSIFLKNEIDKAFTDYHGLEIPNMFLKGTLNFMTEENNLLHTKFEKSNINGHPFRMDMKSYKDHIYMLKKVGVKKLAENFKQDPGYAEGFAIGQAIYFAVAERLNVKDVYPSEFQYTMGLI